MLFLAGILSSSNRRPKKIRLKIVRPIFFRPEIFRPKIFRRNFFRHNFFPSESFPSVRAVRPRPPASVRVSAKRLDGGGPGGAGAPPGPSVSDQPCFDPPFPAQ